MIDVDFDTRPQTNTLAIIAAAFVVAIGIALAGYFLSSPKQDFVKPEPVVDYCSQFDSRAGINGILLDIDRREDEQAELVTTKLQQTNVVTVTDEVIERARVGEQVIVTQLTDNRNEPLLLHADRCRPSNHENIYTDGLGSAQRRIEETFNVPLKEAVKVGSTPRTNSETPLSAGIAGLSAHRSWFAQNPEIPRNLYIFSDFVEFVKGRCAGFKTGIKTKECARHLASIPANLRNTTVYAYQIVREFDGDVQKDVQEVFTAHFKANGATSVIWEKLR